MLKTLDKEKMFRHVFNWMTHERIIPFLVKMGIDTSTIQGISLDGDPRDYYDALSALRALRDLSDLRDLRALSDLRDLRDLSDLSDLRDLRDLRALYAQEYLNAFEYAGGDLAALRLSKLNTRIYEAVTVGGEQLEMGNWHTCNTTHCRAGHAVHKAGKIGYDLESLVGPYTAGAMIYMASTGSVPDFFAENKEALKDLKACAKRER